MKKIGTSLFLICLIHTFGLSQRYLHGTIVDGQSGKKLQGVEIVTSSNDKVVTTKKNGKFKIEVVSETDTIFFVKNGYYSEYTEAKNATKMKVGMTKMPKDLGQVGDSYGNQDRRSNTSSITVLSTKDFNQGAVTDIYQLLRGKIPGLTIRHNAANVNGQPTIMLRNAGNLAGNISPLIVVDGIPNVSLDTVDPNDVASVSVLKDGSAQAIYGSQATGGAIIIKTKKK